MHLFLLFVALFIAVSYAVECGDGAEMEKGGCVCSPGHYSDASESSCAKCPVGRTSLHRGSSSCDVCDAGFVKGSAPNSCVECPAGSTTAGPDQPSCDLCLEGYYGTKGGKAPCRPCPAGYTTNAALGHRDCVACVGPTFNCRSFDSRDSREEVISNLARAIDAINAAIREIYGLLYGVQRRLDNNKVEEKYQFSVEHG